MARKQAFLLASIWRDDDFLRLSAGAQWTYMMLMSQPNLSYCGVISFTPKRWASYCKNSQVRDTKRSVAELVEARFVVVDEATEELWIRSHIKYDGVLKSPNIAIAARKDADAVQSDGIREAIRQTFPELFADGSPDPSGKGSPKGSTNGSEDPSGKGASRACLPEPPPHPLPQPAAAAPPVNRLASVNGCGRSLIESPAAAAAIEVILAIRERQQDGRIHSPAVWRTKTRPKIADEFADRIASYLDAHPDADAPEILTTGCGFSEFDIPWGETA